MHACFLYDVFNRLYSELCAGVSNGFHWFLMLNHMPPCVSFFLTLTLPCYLGRRMVDLGRWRLDFGILYDKKLLQSNWKLAPESKQEPHLYPAIPDAFELMH